MPRLKKCAAAGLPAYLNGYLEEVLNDAHLLNQQTDAGEMALLGMVPNCHLEGQTKLMCIVPAVTPMPTLCIIAEMGANFHQRYHSAEAFARAIDVKSGNKASGGGKLLKRRATHGKKRVIFHLLAVAKAYVIHDNGPTKHGLKNIAAGLITLSDGSFSLRLPYRRSALVDHDPQPTISLLARRTRTIYETHHSDQQSPGRYENWRCARFKGN